MARARLRDRILRFLLLAAAGFVLLTLLLVLPLRWLPPLTTSFMLQNLAEQGSLSARIRYDWEPRAKISRRAALAVMAAEDQKFLDHAGFDFDSIRKAWQRNARSKKVRGASTISQQVAKNLWLWPGRSWMRKGLEAWFTLWLEICCPKARILEIYLNIAQFGPHVFGVEAASRQFYNKPASALNEPEAALLAAVLPNPQQFSVRNPSRHVRTRQAWIRVQAHRLSDELPTAAWK